MAEGAAYYHGSVERDDAVQRLQDDGRDGAFLLRYPS